MPTTYGLPAPDNQSLESVQQALDNNATKLVPVVNSMMQFVNTQGADVTAKTNKVVNRLYNSIQGHLRRNKCTIQSAANAIMSPVATALNVQQASIAGAMSDPPINTLVSRMALPPSYVLPDPASSTVPDPPMPSIAPAPSLAPAPLISGMSLAPSPVPSPPPLAPPSPPKVATGPVILPPPPSPPPVAPPPPSPFVPPAPPPSSVLAPPPAPSSPPPPVGVGPAPGGGPVIQTSTGGFLPVSPSPGAPQTCPPGWIPSNDGLYCLCTSANPMVATSPAQAWAEYLTGKCPATTIASPPGSPPPPAPAPAAGCPQTYTILKGPPCPTYLAVLGSPASWQATNSKLNPGYVVMQTVTDTPAAVQALVNNLAQACINAAIPITTGP